jgi:hypothetical protein
MKILLPFLLITSTLYAQNQCTDFLNLIGQRDISEEVNSFKENCGKLDEKVSSDKKTKTWSSDENGIKLTFINRAKNQIESPKFEVSVIELESSTGLGGYKGEWPFGFKKDMDYKMIKDHVKQLKNVVYERGGLGRSRSYFTYTGPTNQAAQERKVKVYVEQYHGTAVTSMRLRM